MALLSRSCGSGMSSYHLAGSKSAVSARKRASEAPAALTADQEQDIKEAFDLFDMNKDGCLDYHELKYAMEALGFSLRKAEVLKILRDPANARRNDDQMDEQSFTQISASSFPCAFVARPRAFVCDCRADEVCMSVRDMISQRDPNDELRRAFRLFDDDNTGKISLRNLRRVAKELGEGLGDDELYVTSSRSAELPADLA